MSEIERFEMLLGRTGVGLPRGVLGFEARSYAEAIAGGDADTARERFRHLAAAEHWPELRLAIGAALEHARGADDDPTLDDALELVTVDDPDNPLSLALVEEAARSLAAVILRTDERLAVLDRRLADDGASDDLVRTVGEIVVDLLDLDVEDYEDEIAAYLRVGESNASRDQLARATGDEDVRSWARDELEWITDGAEGTAAHALARFAHEDVPKDPAHDAVWVAAVLALVEEAVEIAAVDQSADLELEDAG